MDDSLAPGIGSRLDGRANRDLDVGSLVALAPELGPFASLLGVSEDEVRTVLRGWGVGKFDAELVLYFGLGLSEQERRDLVEQLKSL